MAKDRLTCAVPGCRRSRGLRKGERAFEDWHEWVCGVHWAMVPKIFRRALARKRRITNRKESWNDIRAFNRLWERCKRAAIERAVGIR